MATNAQSNLKVIAYYAGPSNLIDHYEVEKITHLIFCFGVLKGDQFHIRSADDSVTIKKMVLLKKRNPKLKVLLSLGGWGGCETCSSIFSSEQSRKHFAQSIKNISAYFQTDGIDLDWEYPAIKGYPSHLFQLQDQPNFTKLVQEIRMVNGTNFQISFAAGGFTNYIDSSINWKAINPLVDFINIMSYDLVHGYSTRSGHHTPLYSTAEQVESLDHAVQLLLKKGVDSNKLIVGAAFYGRYFKVQPNYPIQLYQPAHFSHTFSMKYFADSIGTNTNFKQFWDSIAQAPYAINVKRGLIATYDDPRSVILKTNYAANNGLGGIMFWQLIDDQFQNGLLDAIYHTKIK